MLPCFTGSAARTPAQHKAAILARLEERTAMAKMSNDEVMAAHRRYVTSGLSVREAAEGTPISEAGLRLRFVSLHLPIRNAQGGWEEDDIPRLLDLHDIIEDEIKLANYGRAAERKSAPKRAAEKKGPVLPTAPSANGHGPKPAVQPKPKPEPVAVPAAGTAVADVGTQLAALQSLLANAQANSVRLSGTIKVELVAELTF